MGIWDVENWLQSITWKQLMLWQEFDRLEPEGVAEDLRAGVIAAEVANTAINFGFAKGKRLKPENFFVSLEKIKKETEKENAKNRGITLDEFTAWKESLKRRGGKLKRQVPPPAQPKGT